MGSFRCLSTSFGGASVAGERPHHAPARNSVVTGQDLGPAGEFTASRSAQAIIFSEFTELFKLENLSFLRYPRYQFAPGARGAAARRLGALLPTGEHRVAPP